MLDPCDDCRRGILFAGRCMRSGMTTGMTKKPAEAGLTNSISRNT